MEDTDESVIYSPDKSITDQPKLRFIHYNDVYHVEAGSRDPVGGFARFKTLCDYYAHNERFKHLPECLTFFSGDAFNPSLESTVTKGKHMVPALNMLNTTASCLGNHDLDFGVEQFEHLAALCTFPWLCANVLDPALGQNVPLGHCKRTYMIKASNGIQIGIMGLVEREWLDTCNSLPPDLNYVEPDVVAKELSAKLRADGADLIIAVSHQRQPNDNKLAQNVEPGTIDIILGGHDHYYAHDVINGTHVLRSGSDFKQLSYIECWQQQNKTWEYKIVRCDVNSHVAQDPAALSIISSITASLAPKLEKVLGYTAAPLDSRFTTVRLKESNIGNFVCDLMRFHYNADCCIIAAGTIRGDQVYPPGVLKVKDIVFCFPFEDPCVVIEVTGQAVLDALENAVSKYPALEGRFPQVSGISFKFDPKVTAGKRCSEIMIKGNPLDLSKNYTMATREYMVRGKDGFTSLLLEEHGGQAKCIVGDETGMLISSLLRQYFMSLKVIGRWKNWSPDLGRHWDEVQEALHEVQPVREPLTPEKAANLAESTPEKVIESPTLVARSQQYSTGSPKKHPRIQAVDESLIAPSDSEDDGSVRGSVSAAGKLLTDNERQLVLVRKVIRKWWRLAGLKGQPATCDSQDEEFGALWARGICPRVEGRIVVLG
ncbi:5'-nucleotidase [Piedraia hortae CBS 480.64]|uniref:5'-nucleotidase n=1 Tax=Piedraia hortae CBS 480.64 TaxID=1314780 RepID=A0A6A7CA62_9PEZI|nr:5'-nucleotidase [Piedraia hortae CBS 480.64]